MPSINELTNIAIQGWADLIGLDKNGRIRKNHPWGNPWEEHHLREHTEKLNESRAMSSGM